MLLHFFEAHALNLPVSSCLSIPCEAAQQVASDRRTAMEGDQNLHDFITQR